MTSTSWRPHGETIKQWCALEKWNHFEIYCTKCPANRGIRTMGTIYQGGTILYAFPSTYQNVEKTAIFHDSKARNNARESDCSTPDPVYLLRAGLIIPAAPRCSCSPMQGIQRERVQASFHVCVFVCVYVLNVLHDETRDVRGRDMPPSHACSRAFL